MGGLSSPKPHLAQNKVPSNPCQVYLNLLRSKAPLLSHGVARRQEVRAEELCWTLILPMAHFPYRLQASTSLLKKNGGHLITILNIKHQFYSNKRKLGLLPATVKSHKSTAPSKSHFVFWFIGVHNSLLLLRSFLLSDRLIKAFFLLPVKRYNFFKTLYQHWCMHVHSSMQSPTQMKGDSSVEPSNLCQPHFSEPGSRPSIFLPIAHRSFVRFKQEVSS